MLIMVTYTLPWYCYRCFHPNCTYCYAYPLLSDCLGCPAATPVLTINQGFSFSVLNNITIWYLSLFGNALFLTCILEWNLGAYNLYFFFFSPLCKAGSLAVSHLCFFLFVPKTAETSRSNLVFCLLWMQNGSRTPRSGSASVSCCKGG